MNQNLLTFMPVSGKSSLQTSHHPMSKSNPLNQNCERALGKLYNMITILN